MHTDKLKGQNIQGAVQLTVQHSAFVRNPCRAVVIVNQDNPFQEVTTTFWSVNTKTMYILVFVDSPKHILEKFSAGF